MHRTPETVRHPYVLSVIETAEVANKIYIVSEPITLLTESLDQENPASMSWGLYTIISAVSFLNRDCQLLHGAVSMSSVFVTRSGDWKLANFELVSEAKDEASIFINSTNLRNEQNMPPEVRPVNAALS